jgi:hypothetical protein
MVPPGLFNFDIVNETRKRSLIKLWNNTPYWCQRDGLMFQVVPVWNANCCNICNKSVFETHISEYHFGVMLWTGDNNVKFPCTRYNMNARIAPSSHMKVSINIKVCNNCGYKMHNAIRNRKLVWHAFVSNPKWKSNPYSFTITDFYGAAIQQVRDIINENYEPINRLDMFYDSVEYNLHKLDNPYLKTSHCWFQTTQWLM